MYSNNSASTLHRLKIQPLHGITVLFKLIDHHAGTPKHNNYKRHDKLGYSSHLLCDGHQNKNEVSY